MMRRIRKLVLAVLLIVACAGGKPIPTDRSLIATPEDNRAPYGDWLTVAEDGLRFQNYSDKESQWYVLGTRLKFKTGGYLAHRGTGEPQDEVYLSAEPDDHCSWSFEPPSADELQAARREPSRRWARIRATGNTSVGGYLATGAALQGHSRGIGQYTPPDYRAVLVRDRAQATIFDVRQYTERNGR